MKNKYKTIKAHSQDPQEEARIKKVGEQIEQREREEELAIAIIGYLKLPDYEPIDHWRDLFPIPRFGIWLSAEECYLRRDEHHLFNRRLIR